MTKVLNVVFSIGTGVTVFVLLLLGIQAFYPAPKYENFCEVWPGPVSVFEKCADNITVGECRAGIGEEEQAAQKCPKEFREANKIYNKNFFVIASILGVITVLAAFFLSKIISISAGSALAGLVLILVAFIRGWESTNDKLKFIVGLIIAAIVIALAVIINKRIVKQKDDLKKPQEL